MNLRIALAAAAVLAASTPALAQQAAQPTAPQAPARPMSPEEIAFSQRGEAFGARINALQAEIQAMLSDGSTDAAQKQANLEQILAAYTPEINAFADELQAFLTLEQSRTTDPQEQAAIAQALQTGPANVRDIPNQMRQSVQRAIAQAQAPARPMSPEETAFSQRGEAFSARMNTMQGEIQAMLQDGSTDAAQKQASLERILAAYTPEINAFADELQAFLTQAQSRSTDPQEQAAIAQALENGPANVRSIPNQMRQGVAQAIAQAQASAQGAPGVPVGQGAVAGTIPVN